jgi:hypothetical protein
MRVSLSSRNRTGHFIGQLKYSTRYYRMKRAESPMGKPRVYKTLMVSAVCPKGKNRRHGSPGGGLSRGKGQVDADLGGGVIKQRIARPGRASRAATARSFCSGRVSARCSSTASRRARERISTPMKRSSSRKLRGARHVLRLTEKQLAELVKEGDLVEVKGNEQDISK